MNRTDLAGRIGILAGLAALAGCGAPGGGLNDDARLIRATLRQLVADGQPICVDSRTNGKPLVIFSTMSVAPGPTRRMLTWRPPSPLRPPADPSAGAIYRDVTRTQPVRLNEPKPPEGALPPLEQRRFNDAARTLAVRDDTATIGVSTDLGVPGVTARWWPVNRFRRSCEPRFVISDPVQSDQIGFVTVKAGHWGTTYAFERRGNDWRPAAEWTRWLY